MADSAASTWKDSIKYAAWIVATYTAAVFLYHLTVGDLEAERKQEQQQNKKQHYLPPGKILFEPSLSWQPVLDNHVLPPGLHIRVNITTGVKEAKLLRPK